MAVGTIMKKQLLIKIPNTDATIHVEINDPPCTTHDYAWSYLETNQTRIAVKFDIVSWAAKTGLYMEGLV